MFNPGPRLDFTYDLNNLNFEQTDYDIRATLIYIRVDRHGIMQISPAFLMTTIILLIFRGHDNSSHTVDTVSSSD